MYAPSLLDSDVDLEKLLAPWTLAELNSRAVQLSRANKQEVRETGGVAGSSCLVDGVRECDRAGVHDVTDA